MRKDLLGNTIEVGDIILSAPLGGAGGEIGRVEKISPTDRITIKVAGERNIYAYEQGAPKVPYKRNQAKTDGNGNYVYQTYQGPYGPRREIVWEEVDDLRDDYTVVGHTTYWIKKQSAEYHVLILRKGTGVTTYSFDHAVAVDFDAEKPDA